jgi:peroxiredoxin
MRLSDYRGKKAVLLNFWATWCPPCRVEMLNIEQAYQYYREKGLEVLAISIDTGTPDSVAHQVSKFVEALNLSYPALLDVEMKVARKYRVMGIPMTYLIDRAGKIRFIEMGFQDWTDSESWRKLDALLD